MKRIDEKLADLKAAQKNGTYSLCPRCGRPTMKPNLYANALSRTADVMVCCSCGLAEAKLAYMNSLDSLYTWAGLQPDKPASDFKSLPGKTVWQRICAEQSETLMKLFHRFCEGEEPEEIRLAAFESCPGLKQIWTEPYRLDFEASDGTVVVRFKNNEMTGAMIEGGDRK